MHGMPTFILQLQATIPRLRRFIDEQLGKSPGSKLTIDVIRRESGPHQVNVLTNGELWFRGAAPHPVVTWLMREESKPGCAIIDKELGEAPDDRIRFELTRTDDRGIDLVVRFGNVSGHEYQSPIKHHLPAPGQKVEVQAGVGAALLSQAG